MLANTPDSKFLAMKGLIPEQEIADLPARYQVAAIHPLSVPGSSHVRHVLDIRRSGTPTPNQSIHHLRKKTGSSM
jgi:hypothetical protein